MKRIGVLTLNDYFNYGNRLQNVALVYFLRQLNKNNFINSLWYNDQKIGFLKDMLILLI